ncbi:AAA family ATPase [Lentzea sp. NPDC003310]|uniref:ATP-dependent nuclease n=1 Tax=Lentzea sp. NPDC003310 TaxID=3154447 RepID=UPI0033B5BF54
MRLRRLRMSGFRSVGPEPVELTLEESTFLLGPNGAGKTVFLHALARMFGSERGLHRFHRDDFHVPLGEAPGAVAERDLWLEAEFVFPELTASQASPAVASHFAHMRMSDADGQLAARFRLSAHLDENGEISDTFVHVLAVDDDDEPTRTVVASPYNRGTIQVHYLPARRDPADHVSYAANSLLGRLLRAADWSAERSGVGQLGKEISNVLAANTAIKQLILDLGSKWRSLHSGSFLTSPGMAFTPSEIEGILRYITVEFTPGPGAQVVDFSRLSDGQQSMLYVALVMTAHTIGRSCLAGGGGGFDVDVLRPPVFTLLAVEEPENSLSPHYLGRMLAALTEMARGQDAQVVVATHSASLMRRVEPHQVRYLRLNGARHTTVSVVTMPPSATEEHKFVREALHAFPELYFARLVVLGEGDSEEIVVPRCLRVSGLEVDSSSVSVVPLGGRHVNHFWRLLNGLGIPHVTLLDLDVGRFQGGWGRVKYAAAQLLKFKGPNGLGATAEQLEGIDTSQDVRGPFGQKVIAWLEGHGVFFSAPLDLDFAMLQSFADAYGILPEEKLQPDKDIIAAVLGAKGSAVAYTDGEQLLFPAYSKRFKGSGSKPAGHIAAVSVLNDGLLLASMPDPIGRLIGQVRVTLEGLPE